MCVFASFWWIFATFRCRLPQLKINKKRPPHSALLLARSSPSLRLAFCFSFCLFVTRKSVDFCRQDIGKYYIHGFDRDKIHCEFECGLLLVYTSSSQCLAPFVCVCIAKLISSRLRRSPAQSRRSRSCSRSLSHCLSNYLLFLEENTGTRT